jgi:hypothetical protein
LFANQFISLFLAPEALSQEITISLALSLAEQQQQKHIPF